jgi:hypothetical protein
MARRTPRQRRAAAPAPAGRPAQHVGATTVHLPSEIHDDLYARGARRERTRSPFNASRVLARTVARYFAVLQQSDPVAAGHLTEEEHEAVLQVLTEPWELTPFHIRVLEAALAERAALHGVLQEAGLDRKAFLERIAALTPTEKARLVDDAEVRWAPEQAIARPE